MLTKKAICKLKEEIQNTSGKPNGSYIKIVGEFLLSHLDKNPNDAENFISEDKTIAKSIEKMKAAAKKKAVQGCAMMTGQEGFAIVLEYFGAKPTVTTVVKPKIEFNVKLDDLL